MERKSGWLIGVLAAALAILYFISLELYLLITLEASFLALLIYGWLNYGKPIGKDYYVYAFITGMMALQFYWAESSQLIELLDVLLFMLAIYALAKHRWYIGWGCMFTAHLLMALITHEKGQTFFTLMQLASAGVAVYAVVRRVCFVGYKTPRGI